MNISTGILCGLLAVIVLGIVLHLWRRKGRGCGCGCDGCGRACASWMEEERNEGEKLR